MELRHQIDLQGSRPELTLTCPARWTEHLTL